MDSLACWNVRGLNEASRQFDVSRLASKINISFIALLEETKV